MASGSRGDRPPPGVVDLGGGGGFKEMSGVEAKAVELEMEWQTTVETEDGKELVDPMDVKQDDPSDPTQIYDNLARLLKLALDKSQEHVYMRVMVGMMVEKFAEQRGPMDTKGDDCVTLYHIASRLEEELASLQPYMRRQPEMVLQDTGEENWDCIRDGHIGLVLAVARLFWQKGKAIQGSSMQAFMEWLSENTYEDPLHPGDAVPGAKIVDWVLKWQVRLGEAVRRLYAILKLHADRSGQQLPMVLGPDICRWPPTSWKVPKSTQTVIGTGECSTQTEEEIQPKIAKVDIGTQANSCLLTQESQPVGMSSDEEEEQEVSWKHRGKRKEKETFEGFDVGDLMGVMDQNRKVFRQDESKRHWGGRDDPGAGPSGSQSAGVGLLQAPSSSEQPMESEEQPPLPPGDPPPPPLSESSKRSRKLEETKKKLQESVGTGSQLRLYTMPTGNTPEPHQQQRPRSPYIFPTWFRGDNDFQFVSQQGWRIPLPTLALAPGQAWIIQEPTVVQQGHNLLHDYYVSLMYSARATAQWVRTQTQHRNNYVWQLASYCLVMMHMNLMLDLDPWFDQFTPQQLWSFYLSVVLEFTMLWTVGAFPHKVYGTLIHHPNTWAYPSGKGEQIAVALRVAAGAPRVLNSPHGHEHGQMFTINERVLFEQYQKFGFIGLPSPVYFDLDSRAGQVAYHPRQDGWPTHFCSPCRFRAAEFMKALMKMRGIQLVSPYDGIIHEGAVVEYDRGIQPKPGVFTSRGVAMERARSLRVSSQ